MRSFARALLFFSWVCVSVPQGFAADAPSAPVSSKVAGQLAAAKGTVEFHAIGHPSAIKIVGKGDALIGAFTIEEKKISGSASFDLTSFKTGIEMRDKHMKEKYLEVEKYPQAKLTLTELVLASPLSGKVTLDSVPFKGTLSLHGVEHAVAGTAKLTKNGEETSFSAQFTIKIDDYAIAVPKFAGITVADEVEIQVDGTTTLATPTPAAK